MFYQVTQFILFSGRTIGSTVLPFYAADMVLVFEHNNTV